MFYCPECREKLVGNVSVENIESQFACRVTPNAMQAVFSKFVAENTEVKFKHFYCRQCAHKVFAKDILIKCKISGNYIDKTVAIIVSFTKKEVEKDEKLLKKDIFAPVGLGYVVSPIVVENTDNVIKQVKEIYPDYILKTNKFKLDFIQKNV